MSRTQNWTYSEFENWHLSNNNLHGHRATAETVIGFQVTIQVKQGLAMLGDYEPPPVSFKRIALII